LRLHHDRTDVELLVLTSEDRTAFGVFYERHAVAMLRYFMYRTASAETAADLTAETFASALASADRFKDLGAGAEGWLYTIARRQLSHFRRWRKVDSRAMKRLSGTWELATEAELDEIHESIDMAALVSKVRSNLDRLPPSQREAVELRVMQQLSYVEVATTLACSVGAARVRVSRGLTRLADELEGANE